MDEEKQIAERLWPEHAELLAEHDWAVLSDLVVTNREPNEAILEPQGEAKDAFLASLMIIFWTMKIAHMGFQIAKEVSHLRGQEKATAVLERVLSRIDDTTPRQVSSRVKEILDQLNPS